MEVLALGTEKITLHPNIVERLVVLDILSVIENEQMPDNSTLVVSFLHLTCEK